MAFESVELTHADSPATMVIQALLGSFDASVTSAVNSTSSMVSVLAGYNERQYPLVNSAMTFNTQYRYHRPEMTAPVAPNDDALARLHLEKPTCSGAKASHVTSFTTILFWVLA
jgi:hypothetical protein